MSLASDVAELKRFQRAYQRPAIDPADRERFAWYADSCPCGVEPGQCAEHPRARPAQTPPTDRDWRTFCYMAGRGSGKTRAGACWVIDRVQRGLSRAPLLVGQTAADVRDIMVRTILDVSPPWFRPKYQPSRRAIVWPNGASGLCLSAEDPEQARGPNADLVWADELGAWSRARETWRNLSLALRKGSTQAFVSTTPKRIETLVTILAQPTTVVSTESTLANRQHLSPEFIDQVLALYRGTRFEDQEIQGRLIDTVEGAWFRFDDARHVQPIAVVPGLPIMISVDAGTSRWTAATFFQCQRIDRYRIRFLILDDYLAVDRVSSDNAEAIRAQFRQRFPGEEIDRVFIDGASSARTSIGPAALGEYQRVFTDRKVLPIWRRSVTDSLDMIEAALDRGDLVVHGKCGNLISAFKNYARQQVGGEFTDQPALLQHPSGDMLDCLAYGVMGVMGPEGRKPDPCEFAPRIPYRRLF
jgi:phage terminase large subunit-like protein